MYPPLVSFGVRLSLCTAATYLLWRQLGPVGIAVAAPLFGFALARPILELIAESRAVAKRRAFSDIEGRHFEYRGLSLDVVEDEGHHRWISVNDVRKVIESLPRDPVLQKQFPGGVQDDPALGSKRIRADALRAYLGKATEADSVRFRNWLQREVVFPSAKVRQRLGIPDDAPARPADDGEAP